MTSLRTVSAFIVLKARIKLSMNGAMLVSCASALPTERMHIQSDRTMPRRSLIVFIEGGEKWGRLLLQLDRVVGLAMMLDGLVPGVRDDDVGGEEVGLLVVAPLELRHHFPLGLEPHAPRSLVDVFL